MLLQQDKRYLFKRSYIEIVRNILRDEWGFKGVVVTDWGAMNSRVEAFKAGVDLEMPFSGKMFDKEVLEAVRNGALDQGYIDEAVERILTLVREKAATRKHDYAFNREKHHLLAKHIELEGAVLMKNEEGVLPLGSNKKVLLVGALADDFRFQGSGSPRIVPTKLVSIRKAMELGGYNYRYCRGYETDGTANQEYVKEAVREARKLYNVISPTGQAVFLGLKKN